MPHYLANLLTLNFFFKKKKKFQTILKEVSKQKTKVFLLTFVSEHKH